MKSRIIVVLGLVVALVALGALAGCGQIVEKAVEGATGVSVDEDEGSVTIEGEDGSSVTFDDEGATVPEDFPSDVPVYDGTITASWETSVDGGTSYQLTITTSDSVEDVIAWYESELEDEGWTINSTFKDSSNGMIGAEKGDMAVYIAAGAGSEGTDLSLTVGPK